MKQTGLSIALSAFFLVSGVVLFYQSSNPAFISNADTVSGATYNISNLLAGTGIVLVVLSAVTIYIQYLIITKRGQ